jgi:hypothetical protein
VPRTGVRKAERHSSGQPRRAATSGHEETPFLTPMPGKRTWASRGGQPAERVTVAPFRWQNSAFRSERIVVNARIHDAAHTRMPGAGRRPPRRRCGWFKLTERSTARLLSALLLKASLLRHCEATFDYLAVGRRKRVGGRSEKGIPGHRVSHARRFPVQFEVNISKSSAGSECE